MFPSHRYSLRKSILSIFCKNSPTHTPCFNHSSELPRETFSVLYDKEFLFVSRFCLFHQKSIRFFISRIACTWRSYFSPNKSFSYINIKTPRTKIREFKFFPVFLSNIQIRWIRSASDICILNSSSLQEPHQ